MYPDHSLMPKEAIRLAALGMLAEAPRSYADLAAAVRDFTSHVMGPNLDLMGTSVRLLCYEGLATAGGDGIDHGAPVPPDAILSITASGREELDALLLASVRSPFNDVNKLVIALKMRFFGLLGTAKQLDQIELVTAALANEHARLSVLRDKRAAEAGGQDALTAWLDHDLGQIADSLAWFQGLRGAA